MRFTLLPTVFTLEPEVPPVLPTTFADLIRAADSALAARDAAVLRNAPFPVVLSRGDGTYRLFSAVDGKVVEVTGHDASLPA